MRVYELMIDQDCTTRSRMSSYGLFSTEKGAYDEKFRMEKRGEFQPWMFWEVRARTVR